MKKILVAIALIALFLSACTNNASHADPSTEKTTEPAPPALETTTMISSAPSETVTEAFDASTEIPSDYGAALQNAPQKMDEAHYRVGKFVLTSVDVYISGMITRDELGQSVFYARDSLSELGNGTTEYETGNILVSGQVLMLYNDLTYLDASDDELVSHRNLLADALGEPRS